MCQVDTPTLSAGLEQALAQHFDKPCRIARLQRNAYAFRSSYALEELTVDLEDGQQLSLLFKNLNRDHMVEGARGVKPGFLYDPRREVETYRLLLNSERLGTPICYGTLADDQAESYGLFLEKVPGKELYQLGEFEQWENAARWLANLHTYSRHLPDFGRRANAAHLLHYNGDFYARWSRRARRLLTHGASQAERKIQRQILWLLDCYARVIPYLAALPATWIHGEFYASNILVRQLNAGVRVCAVDWEMAAVGPAAIDLAALTSGSWSEEQRMAMINAYHAEMRALDDCPMAPEDFRTALECCRLHLAIQWLAWSAHWSPPPDQAQNWLEVALRAAEEMEL